MAGTLAQFFETAAFGALNDVLSGFHTKNGYAVPNRFEAIIIPPTSMARNSPTSQLVSGHYRKAQLLQEMFHCV